MEARASICAVVDNQGEVAEAEQWLEENAKRLSFVSEMNGCGCCLFMWDIRGPKELLATLPMHLSAAGEWDSSNSGKADD